MKVIRSSALQYSPASHEDPQNPGVLKKVLMKQNDIKGQLRMINDSLLPVGKSFKTHFHESLTEVFIMTTGKVEVVVNEEKVILEKGDIVIIEPQEVHSMTNIDDEDATFITLGFSNNPEGKTTVL